MSMVFSCPVCRGPIALWAVLPAFTCHHCQWAVSSNIRAARVKAVAVAVVAEAVLLLALLLSLPRASTGLIAWLSVVGLLGLAVGWFALKAFVSLQPMHPQAPASPNHSVKGTATSGLRPLASAPYVER